MLKEILSISGKPGLYKLVSRAKNLLVVESISDKKRVPAYAHDKVISLSDVSVYIDEGETSIREVLTAIKEKEGGKNVSIDFAKVQNDDLREYFGTVLPNFDREKVYPTDIKKILKWYDILLAAGITEYAAKEDETQVEEEAKAEDEAASDDKDAKKPAAKAASGAKSTKRKESSVTATKASAKVKSTPKTATPKKSSVGAKRGG